MFMQNFSIKIQFLGIYELDIWLVEQKQNMLGDKGFAIYHIEPTLWH